MLILNTRADVVFRGIEAASKFADTILSAFRLFGRISDLEGRIGELSERVSTLEGRMEGKI